MPGSKSECVVIQHEHYSGKIESIVVRQPSTYGWLRDDIDGLFPCMRGAPYDAIVITTKLGDLEDVEVTRDGYLYLPDVFEPAFRIFRVTIDPTRFPKPRRMDDDERSSVSSLVRNSITGSVSGKKNIYPFHIWIQLPGMAERMLVHCFPDITVEDVKRQIEAKHDYPVVRQILHRVDHDGTAPWRAANRLIDDMLLVDDYEVMDGDHLKLTLAAEKRALNGDAGEKELEGGGKKAKMEGVGKTLDEGTFEITMKVIAGNTWKLSVAAHTTTKSIKVLNQDAEGTAPDQQELSFNGHVMHDDDTVGDYGIKEHDTVHLKYTQRGSKFVLPDKPANPALRS